MVRIVDNKPLVRFTSRVESRRDGWRARNIAKAALKLSF